MRIGLIVGLLVMALPAAGLARMDCPDWKHLDKDGKNAAIADMIEGHLTSNKSQRYTSANRVAIGRCLNANVGRMTDDMDHECSSSGRSQDPIDDTFDRYLLSCIE